jgi:P27 family predicted phage terminase small subunit
MATDNHGDDRIPGESGLRKANRPKPHDGRTNIFAKYSERFLMGRTGKTKAAHKRDGTLNVTRHGKGNLPIEIPDMPADLSPSAQATWKVTTQLLSDAGIVSKLDGKALRLLCEVDAIRLEAFEQINANLVVAGSKGPIINPAVRIYFESWKCLKSMCQQFGLTPVGRRGLDLNSKPTVDDDASRILGFKIA